MPRVRARAPDQHLVSPGRLSVSGAKRRAASQARSQRRAAEPVRALDAVARAARDPRDRSGAVDRGRLGRELQPGRRRGVSVAVRLGLRRRRARARRRSLHVHPGHRLRDPRAEPSRRVDHRSRQDRDERGRQRRRRALAGGRALARRRASQPPAPSRDLLDRAAQALAQAAGRRPRATDFTFRSRRAARSSAASATKRCRRAPDQQSSYRFLALYSRALLRTCPILGRSRSCASGPASTTSRRTTTRSSARSTTSTASSRPPASWATAS